MTKDKAEKIIRIYDWTRFIILMLLLSLILIGVANAQPTEYPVAGQMQTMLGH